MSTRKLAFARGAAALAGASLFAATAIAQPVEPPPAEPAPVISIELNKLDQVDTACFVYFVVHNGTGEQILNLGLEVYYFDTTGGLVGQPNSYSFTGLRPAADRVFSLTLADRTCSSFSRILVNRVTTCERPSGQDPETCAAILSTTSRAAVTFEY